MRKLFAVLRFETRILSNSVLNFTRRNPTGAYSLVGLLLCGLILMVLANVVLAVELTSRLLGSLRLFISIYVDLTALMAFATGIVLCDFTFRKGRLITESFRSRPVPLFFLYLGQLLPLFLISMCGLWILTGGVWVVLLGRSSSVHWVVLVESFLLMLVAGWLGIAVFSVSTLLTGKMGRILGSVRYNSAARWWLVLFASLGATALRGFGVSPGTATDWSDQSLLAGAVAIAVMLLTGLLGWLASLKFAWLPIQTPSATPMVRFRVAGRSDAATVARWGILSQLRDFSSYSFVYLFLAIVGLGLWGISRAVPAAYGYVREAAIYVTIFVTATVAICALGSDSRYLWVFRTAPIGFGRYLAGKAFSHLTWSIAAYLLLIGVDQVLRNDGPPHVMDVVSVLSVHALGFYLGSWEPVAVEESVKMTVAAILVLFIWGGISLTAQVAIPWGNGLAALVVPVVVAFALLSTRFRLRKWQLASLWDEPNGKAENQEGM